MNIIKGKIKRPTKLFVYGVEGVGKSTFAAQFPTPLFIDLEDRTAHLDIDRVPCSNYAEFSATLAALKEEMGEYKTLVIDTVDWLETMIQQHVANAEGHKSIEDFGYGRGYKFVQERMNAVIDALTDLQQMHGCNIVLVGHALIKKFEDPYTGASYDRYLPKGNDKFIALVKEWVDNIFFANYETFIISEKNKKDKATGGKNRILHTEHHAAFDGKNSWELPQTIPMEFSAIEKHVPVCAPNPNYKTTEQRAYIAQMRKEAIAKVKAEMLPVSFLADLLEGKKFEDFTLAEAAEFMKRLDTELEKNRIPK